MSNKTSKQSATFREQVETAKRYFEVMHGKAIERDRPIKAHAYYDAVTMLESAMNDELKAPQDPEVFDFESGYIESSQNARDEGYAAATLRGQRHPEHNHSRDGFFSWLRKRFV